MRIARKRDTAWAAFKRSLHFGSGPSRVELAVAAHTAEVAQIKATRALVFQRDKTCTVCFGTRRRECVKAEHEMNEIIPRSKTRGLPPEERFNVHICHRVCNACHQDITENRVKVSGDANMPGGLRVEAA